MRIHYIKTDAANSILRQGVDSNTVDIVNIYTALNNYKRNYVYCGYAVPNTVPLETTYGIFYITRDAGTYTNFKDSQGNAIVIKNGTYVLSRAYGYTYWAYHKIADTYDVFDTYWTTKHTHSISFDVGSSYPWKELDNHSLINNQKYAIVVDTESPHDYRIVTRKNGTVAEILVDDKKGSNVYVATPTLDCDSIWISIRKDNITYDGSYTITIYPYEQYVSEVVTSGDYVNSSILTLNPSTEFDDKFRQATRMPRYYETVQGVKPLVLAHFSDIHGDTTNLSRIMEFCEKYDNYIDDILCGGDIHKSYWDDGISWYTSIPNTNKILFTPGNHDYYATEGGGGNTPTYKSSSSVYERFVMPFMSSWNAVTTVNRNYYYKDYSDSKIRLIVIDYYDWDSVQETWLTNTLSSAISDGLQVIISSHVPASWDLDFIDCPFTSYQKRNEPSSLKDTTVASVVQSFIDNGGVFICYLTGHTHLDAIGTLKDYPKQLNITIDCASSRYSDVIVSDVERVVGTKSQDLFNIVSINPYDKVIKIMRVGANYDSWLRKKDTLCWDYQTSSLLNEVDLSSYFTKEEVNEKIDELSFVDEASLTRLTNTLAPVFLDPSATVYVEYSGGNEYIKITGSKPNVMIRNKSLGNTTYSWTDIITLNGSSVTSPAGITNCLKISSSQALMYNVVDGSFVVTAISQLDNAKHIALFYHYYTVVGGILYDIYADKMNTEARTTLETLYNSLKVSNIGSDAFIELVKQKASSTSTVATNSAGITEVTLSGTGSQRTHFSTSIPCEPLKVVTIEFYGKSTHPHYDNSFTTCNGWFMLNFFDKNGTQIGDQAGAFVVGENRCGYHRFGWVAPMGTKSATLSFITRGSTVVVLHDFNLQVLNDIPIRDRQGIKYDAHLGMIKSAPMNTIPAFELAKKAGFRTCISNCNWTSDGVLVSLHDDTIDATSDGTGNVHELTFEELQAYDFGSWFNAAYTGTKIPKLETFVQIMASEGVAPIFRLHNNWNTETGKVYLQKIYELICKYGFKGNACVKSFEKDVITACYSVMGTDVEYVLDCDSLSDNTLSYYNTFSGDLTLELPFETLLTLDISSALANGVKLSAYTPNNATAMRDLFLKGVTRFCTDTFSDIVFPVE